MSDQRPAWVAPWVGLPFRSKGRGPDAYDCYGLARAAVEARFGVLLPAYLDGYDRAEDAAEVERVVAAALPAWRAVARDGEREGDLALMKTADGRPGHVALLVGSGFLLEMLPHWHSVCPRLDSAIQRPRILGFFRHPVMEDVCPISPTRPDSSSPAARSG